MTKTRIILVGLAILAISAFGLLKATKADISFLDKIAQIAGQVVGNTLSEKVNSSGALDNLKAEDLTLGAMPGSELPGPAFIVGGVQHYFQQKPLTVGTTTPCALQAPSSTSTLIAFSAQFKSNGSTSPIGAIDFGKATTAFATTTLLATSNPLAISAANGSGTFYASTTPNNVIGTGNLITFAPNNWAVVKVAPAYTVADLTTFKPVGTCLAEWIIQ